MPRQRSSSRQDLLQVWPAIIYGTVTINTTERNGGVLVASGISLAIGIIVPPIVVRLGPQSLGFRVWLACDGGLAACMSSPW